jgi:hypothetical protein
VKYKLLLLVSVIILYSCEYKPQKQKKEQHIITEELHFSHFDDYDSVYWVGNDGNYYGEIEDGAYYFETLDTTYGMSAPEFNIEINEDFSVEIAITGPTADTVNYFGLTIGKLLGKDGFVEFLIRNTDEYLISSNTQLIKGRFKNITETLYKKLKINKLDHTWHFFINDEKVYSYDFAETDGFRCGPLTGYSSMVWVDYIKINRVLYFDPEI